MPGYSGIIFDGDGGQGKGHIYCDGVLVGGFGAECNWFDCVMIQIGENRISVRELAYPIGSLYPTELDSQDPNEILGFGKWEIIVKEPVYFWRRDE